MTAARSIIAGLLCSAAVVCVVEGCGFHYPAVVGREQVGTVPEAFTVSLSCHGIRQPSGAALPYTL